ncbi:uncharacterized protein KY384_008815 [Bacidia gigantensis]|uniref:uncharacterized protein n=1 Tax=Bacidia gigantensis TaxID=2732470 RepID=UPI001D048D22|nr:uncharacterized protein KY384_008815 [Bacidia gigantensis]KAG8526614.1 hypothetical protein KY384_008815 [Bacidia gigantensis]
MLHLLTLICLWITTTSSSVTRLGFATPDPGPVKNLNTTPVTFSPKCKPFPATYNPAEWALTIQPECQQALDYFKTWAQATPNFPLMKTFDETCTWYDLPCVYAPTYFVFNDCAFTFYLLDGAVELPSMRTVDAINKAGNVLNVCKYYGELQIDANVEVAIMDGLQALREAQGNGNPVFPPQMVPVLQFRNATVPPGLVGSVSALSNRTLDAEVGVAGNGSVSVSGVGASSTSRFETTSVQQAPTQMAVGTLSTPKVGSSDEPYRFKRRV